MEFRLYCPDKEFYPMDFRKALINDGIYSPGKEYDQMDFGRYLQTW